MTAVRASDEGSSSTGSDLEEACTTTIPPRRRRVFKWMMVCLAALSLLVALEVTARVLRLGGDEGGLVPHPVYHHCWPRSYRAPALGVHRDWGGHDMISNADGLLMEAELPAERVPSVVFLGDSFTAARQVEERERFATLVGRRLGLPAYNFGCGSYSPILSRLQLEQFEERIEPRVVVLTLYTNDFVDEVRYRERAERSATGRVVAVPGYHVPAWRRAARRSSLYRFLRVVMLSRASPAEAGALERVRPLPERTTEQSEARSTPDTRARVNVEGRRRVEESLAEIAAWCQERGSRLVLTTVPDQVALAEGTPDQLARYAAGVSQRLGIVFVDATAEFRAADDVKALFLPLDAHFTALGHEAFARALIPSLEPLVR